jgi:hypothetical protein
MGENILKKIGILEFHCHLRYLYTVAKICKTKQTNVTIFTNQDLYSKIKTYIKNIEDYEIVLKKENESIKSFLKKVEKICNDRIDLLFINTFQLTCFYLPRYIGFNPKCKTIFTVHTVNAWLKPKPVFDIKQIIKSIDTNLCSFIGPKFMLPKYDAINVVYPTLKDYVEQETDYKKRVFKIPFGFFDETSFKKVEKDDKKIRFMITGQIEEHRRDYNSILDVFEKLFPEYNNKIQLILLGYPVGTYGTDIIKRCKTLKEKDFDIKYFESFVPEKEYNDSVKKVDFIILPIKIKSKGMGIVPEYYGKTKGNAGIFEGIQYAKPMILPAEFNIIEELKSSILSYKNQENLEKTIIDLTENTDKITQLKQNAYKNSKKFSMNVLHDYFVKEIYNKLDEL